MFVIKVGWFPRLGNSFLVLVKNTDAAVLPYPVGDFQGVYPHGELTRESLVKEGGREPAAFACLTDYRVHFTIYPYTPVPGPLEWFFWEPVVSVASPQDLDEAVTEFLEL